MFVGYVYVLFMLMLGYYPINDSWSVRSQVELELVRSLFKNYFSVVYTLLDWGRLMTGLVFSNADIFYYEVNGSN